MNLTPIRVRGKPNSAAATKRKAVSRVSDSAAPGNDATEPSSKRPRMKKAVKTSLVERELPLEILERIFIFSENLNLARASPLLGRMLSGRPTLVALVIQAFGPTWDTEIDTGKHGSPEIALRVLEHVATAVEDRSGRVETSPILGNPDLQSSVLACEWVNLDLILEAQETWARQVSNRGPENIGLNGTTGNDGSKVSYSHQEHLSARTGYHREYEESAAYAFVLRPTVPEFRVPSRLATCLHVHPDTRIPDRLISGPWTSEMVEMFCWLRRGGARFRESQTWELKLEGLQLILTSPEAYDLRLIVCLCLMDDFFWTPEAGWDGDDRIHFHKSLDWPRDVLIDLSRDLAGLVRHPRPQSRSLTAVDALRAVDDRLNRTIELVDEVCLLCENDEERMLREWVE